MSGEQVRGAALELRGLSASYGAIEVVHGVDLVVNPGEVYALIGPIGAGKSTLMKVASGCMAPSAGELRVAGQLQRRPRPDRLAKLGLRAIPEGRAIFPNLTVRDNLKMWSYLAEGGLAEVEALSYARFPRLAERRGQVAGTLSGGEQQMLAISRALVGHPRILLLDELSMGLAPKVVAELYEAVAELAASGMTVLVVEQFAATALGLADRAGVMQRGRLVFEGSPAQAAERWASGGLGASR